MSGKRVTYWAVLVGIPVLVAALWLASGREVFTKHLRVVSVTVTDPLFGDTTVEQRFVAGPIFGYYVGLDLVLGAVLLSLVLACLPYAIAGIAWLLAHRRTAREEPT